MLAGWNTLLEMPALRAIRGDGSDAEQAGRKAPGKRGRNRFTDVNLAYELHMNSSTLYHFLGTVHINAIVIK